MALSAQARTAQEIFTGQCGRLIEASVRPGVVDLFQTRGTWIESDRVQGLIVDLIVLNAVILGLETSQSAMERLGRLPGLLDCGILAVFVVEIGFKLYTQCLGFFHVPWNVSDFVGRGRGDHPDPRQQSARSSVCLAGAADSHGAAAPIVLCLRGHGYQPVR